MRHLAYLPWAVFIIILSLAGKTFATPINGLQDIIEWFSVPFAEPVSGGPSYIYSGASIEQWGVEPYVQFETLPPRGMKMGQRFTDKPPASRHDRGTGVTLFLFEHIGIMTISASGAGGEPSAFGSEDHVSRHAGSDLLSKIVPVPEPGTMLLFGTGLVGLASLRLRRKG